MTRPLELVILSGKGGTGKTSVTATLATIALQRQERPLLLADCDVDAANLGLIVPVSGRRAAPFVGGDVASIDRTACTACGACVEHCAFGAISSELVVDAYACEGCGVCQLLCPQGAVTLEPEICGDLGCSYGESGRLTLIDAHLKPGRGNSGKLVAAVRRRAREVAAGTGAGNGNGSTSGIGTTHAYDLIIADGPPGLGCPVISTVTGADLALIVAEPSVGGIHDLERTIELCGHFGVPGVVTINKSDLNPDGVTEIVRLCGTLHVPVVSHLPFDAAYARRLAAGTPLTPADLTTGSPMPMIRALCKLWTELAARLKELRAE